MTDHALQDTWSWREYPVLREVARILDSGPYCTASFSDITAATGLNDDQVHLAARALDDAGLLDARISGERSRSTFARLAPEARQLVGLWPTPESALDRMITALETIAANTDDEDERTKAQRFATWLRAGATTVGLSVASAAITGQIPGGTS